MSGRPMRPSEPDRPERLRVDQHPRALCTVPLRPAERRAAERRRQRQFVLLDRRSGFDRRRRSHATRLGGALESALLQLRDDPHTLLAVLLLANLLSLLDLESTWYALAHGALEGNPLMRSLLAASPAVAATFKLCVVAALSALVWWLRRYRRMLQVALLTAAVYGAVIAYQLAGLTRLY